MTNAVLELPDTVQATRKYTQFVCDVGHQLETPRHSPLDKRIQLHARGHHRGEFALPTDECIVCCAERRQLAHYLSYQLMKHVRKHLPRTYVTKSPIAHQMRVRESA